MFKLSNRHVKRSDTTQEPKSEVKATEKRFRNNLLNICIVVVMCGLLFYAVSDQLFKPRTDAGKYQCYALVFWQGTHAVHVLPPEQCMFLNQRYYSPASIIQGMKTIGVPAGISNVAESQTTSGSFRNLPYEYPLLSIIPFSLGLIAPTAWYQVVFAIWMLLLAAIIYAILSKTRSTGAAIAFAFYLVVGKWAFVLLALATMIKFFPVVLVIPFLIAQQKQYSEKWYSGHRWSALGVYCGICIVATLLSLSLNIGDTINPFLYFFNRPIQVESVPATLLWLGNFLGYPTSIEQSFGSVNILGALSQGVSLASSLCLVVGLLYTFWLQWRGKLDIYTASLLTVLIIIITGKVFSPQYLIWIAPLLAFVGKANWKWLVTWGIVGLLTTWVYPNMYNSVKYVKYVPLLTAFYPVVLVRNLLILGFIIVLLYQATRKRFVVTM